MMKQLMVLGVALAAGACAVEHKTVVVADDPCTTYGFTASSADYARCQARIAEQRRLGRVAVNYGDARIMTDSQAACTSYGIPRGTAQYDRCVQNEFAARRPHELSGGQRQRVGVARALAADPPILLMDEPFGALDPVTRAELQREFSALAKRLRKTIVFVTHDLREALLLASRIVLLEKGRIVADATPQEFPRIDHPEVRAFTASLAPLSGVQA